MVQKGGAAGKTKILLVLAIIIAGFFCFQKGKMEAADNQKILISEIQASGATVNDEFIELYNPNNQDIDLKGYSLKKKTSSGNKSNLVSSTSFSGVIPAYGYFLISHPSYKDVIGADISYSGSSSSFIISNNYTIILYDITGVVVDKVGYGNASDFETATTSNPGNNQSIARKITDGIMQDTGNNSVDFEIKDAPNPQNTASAKLIPNVMPPDNPPPQNSTSTPPILPPANDNGGGSGSAAIFYSLGQVIINEFVSDPSDGEEEWIELYNTANQTIDLSGWTIEEGSGAKTNLSGQMGFSGESRFFVIENPTGNLNNSGDIIILRDGVGNLIDQVSYGAWDDGNKGNNAPLASDPKSIARKFDGYNTYNNSNDFAVTATLTKNKSNVISEEGEKEEASGYDYSNDIIISEILPNPKGDDTAGEFIEFYNKGARDVDLLGWRLGDESAKKYEIASSSIIKAGGYSAIYRSESKIALNNNSDSVKLYQPFKDEPLQTVKYDKVIENWSFNYISSNKWLWSEIATPGKVNEIRKINHAPVVDFDCPEEILVGFPIIFDSSDTIDEDDDKLSFNWDFGDGIKSNLPSPEHTFFKIGAFNVKLTVSDGASEAKKERIVKVVDNLTILSNFSLAKRENAAGADIIINEFLPSPEGSDAEEEWIELYNKGRDEVNLINWKMDDSESGSKPYKFLDDLWLTAGMFYVLERPESGLALNNTGDVVRLFNDLDELMDEVEYEAAREGGAYARGANGEWYWTTVLTPGGENEILASNQTIKQNSNKAKKQGIYFKTTLETIKEFETGDLVAVAGTVAVEPGIFGVQYFYIVGSPGIQVYNYKKDFPGLKVGDYIEVKGELSMVNGELRLKTKTVEDIQVVEHRNEPIAEEISGDKLTDEYVGQLVRIAGEITEKKGVIIYLDDGLGEVITQIKRNTGINMSDFSEGEAVAVTGIVSRSSSGIKILPRSPRDIIRENDIAGVEVLGASSETDEWALAARKKKILYYILISLGGVIIIASVAWWRKFKKKKYNKLNISNF